MTWMKPLTIAVTIGILATPAIEQTVQAKTVLELPRKWGREAFDRLPKLMTKANR